MGAIRLKDAVARYAAEHGAWANSYEWYRRSARERGTVYIGTRDIPAHKVGREWFVSTEDLELGIASHRAGKALLHQVTDDYRDGILHGQSGSTVYTEWGGYRRSDPFHFAWSNYEAARRRSDGSWYCNACMKSAKTEEQWDGEDFIVTRVYCESCGASQKA